MTWEDLIEKAKDYKTIIITGCQRTGTTYAAKELARVLEYKHIDESQFGTHYISNLKMFIQNIQEPKVIQAPAVMDKLLELSKDVLIVMMTRDEDDVAKSMLKHNWFRTFGREEYNKFKEGIPPTPQYVYRVKTEFGRKHKFIELPYTELEKTENFITDRKGFTIKQTELK